MNPEMLEKLAALEHEQWSAWTRHFLDHSTPENMERWRRQSTTPYENLTEEEKEADRIWARKMQAFLAATPATSPSVLYEGKFIKLLRRGKWEYVERNRTSGIVAILAVTPDAKLILVEQFRPPLGKNVIEIPAGLAGDIAGSENEDFAEAARRELFEETGYEAGEMHYLTEGPASAGLSTEVITFFRATHLVPRGKGGGDASENIIVHQIPLKELESWLQNKREEGCLVDYKIYTALYFHGATQT